jgi:hypothetical protein
MATVFTKAITIDAPDKDIVFDGCDFTGDFHLTLTAAKSVSFLNCRFYNITPYAKRSYLFLSNKADPLKLTINGCYFGDFVENEEGKIIYNLLELYSLLADGSSISNNYFTKNCCTHNQINIYASDEGATIALNNNYFVSSKNGYRIGIKEEPTCTLNINNNTFETTDDDVDWAGLVIIQPCAKATTSFNNLTVNINGTVNKSGVEQLVYLFANSSDTHFHATKNMPNVFVDGKKVEDIHLAYGTTIDSDEEETTEETAATVTQ